MNNDDLAEQAAGLRAEVTGLAGMVHTLVNTRVALLERTTRRYRGYAIGLVISLVLDLALTAGLVWTQDRQATFAACQAHYNDVINRRSAVLTNAADAERMAERASSDALNAVLLDPSLLKPAEQRTTTDALRVQKLFLTYRTAAQKLIVARTAADKARAANPVPPPPSTTCG